MIKGKFFSSRTNARVWIIVSVLVLCSLFLFFSQQRRFVVSSTPADELSILLAGDAIITQPWSHLEEAEFLQLIEEIRGVDVAIVNLEMLIHDFKGYGQANSGGTYMAARPKIAYELAWVGFDMAANANNHTFDYGSIGVLETVENVTKAGIVIAGAGKDLQNACAPRYFQHTNGTVALVSASSSFTEYGKASHARPDLHGRPGLNPLTLIAATVSTITRATAEHLLKMAQEEGISESDARITQSRGGGERLSFLGQTYQLGDENGTTRTSTINQTDLERNLESIREAEENADLVVFSIHAHSQGQWLTDLAHQAIDEGADVFFAHGPHQIRPIEIYKGKPIFYSMGDFVFQNEQIELFPPEFYNTYGLGDDATPEDAQNARSRGGTRGFPADRRVWEGFLTNISFKNGEITEIRLIPVDMGFGKPVPIRGRPKYADKELGKYIIEYAMNQSERYGTEIEYVESENIGLVKIK